MDDMGAYTGGNGERDERGMNVGMQTVIANNDNLDIIWPD